MQKKLLSILLTLVMVLSIAPISVFAQDDILSYLTYEISDGEVIITGCDESISGDVVIPDTIDGCSVTVIAQGAFQGCKNIESIIIPESVTTIREVVFSDTSIKSIFVPASTVLLTDTTFSGCRTLEEIIVDSNNECYSSENGVLFNKNKTHLMTYPEGKKGKEYIVSDNVTSIGAQAISSNENIESIIIPDSVTSIGAGAFGECINLVSITLSENITEIAENAFALCFNLKQIDIPDNVVSIGDAAFSYCMSLEEISIPENVQVISDLAFYFCLKLEKAEINADTATIALLAFAACQCLEEVYLYNPDVVIDEMAFGYVSFLVNGDKSEVKEYVDLYKTGLIARMHGDEEALQEVSKLMEEYDVIYPDELKPLENFSVYGYEGSTAQTYAEENGFNFVALCEHNYVDTVITAATYTQTGEGGMVCEYCGDVDSTYEIPVLEVEDSEEKENADTGVSVIFPEGTFEGDAEIDVTPVSEGDAFKLISHKEGNYKVTMFDINVTVDGENVQPNGAVLVKIPLPRGYNQNKCVVYYVAEDGTMEELKTYHYKDGYVYFETDHFSYYAIVEDVEEEETKGWISEIRSFFESVKEFIEKFMELLRNFLAVVE